MTEVNRSYEARVSDVVPEERAVIAQIGGKGVDRHRSIIDPSGIDLTNYRKNPIVLFEHGRDPHRGTMPIGKNKWIHRHDGRHLYAKTLFWDDEYSRELFRAYEDGLLRGWSINVVAHEASPPTRDEIRATPSLEADCDLIYRRTELAEYSAVAIPSYRDALTVLEKRGIWVPAEARTMTAAMGGVATGGGLVRPNALDADPDEGPPRESDEEPSSEEVPRAVVDGDEPEPIHEAERKIVEADGQFYVYSEDGSKELGGPYASKEQAEHRLKQIEWFKNHGKGRSCVDIARLRADDWASRSQALREEVRAMIELIVYGRV